jgi:hypothetical protein
MSILAAATARIYQQGSNCSFANFAYISVLVRFVQNRHTISKFIFDIFSAAFFTPADPYFLSQKQLTLVPGK